MQRGFTLIELAIVIVIAGILAAIAVPIYQSLVEQSKWTEAKGIASTIRTNLEVFYTQNNGWTRQTSSGDVTVGNEAFATFSTKIGMTANDLGNMRYFHPAAIELQNVGVDEDTGLPTFSIVIDGNHEDNPPGAPSGVYTLTHAGFEDLDTTEQE